MSVITFLMSPYLHWQWARENKKESESLGVIMNTAWYYFNAQCVIFKYTIKWMMIKIASDSAYNGYKPRYERLFHVVHFLLQFAILTSKRRKNAMCSIKHVPRVSFNETTHLCKLAESTGWGYLQTLIWHTNPILSLEQDPYSNFLDLPSLPQSSLLIELKKIEEGVVVIALSFTHRQWYG